MEQASQLLAAKTLTISKLLALAPPGTLDPTPHLYDSTMYTLAGMMGVAVVAHGLVRPIAPKTIDVTATATAVEVNDEHKDGSDSTSASDAKADADAESSRVFEEKQKKWESDEGERHVNK